MPLRITLVTPVLNGARFIEAAIASIRAQRYPELEYIVCDGGSTDGTLEILEANRDLITHLLVGKDQGMYDALMKGFRQATGDILGWVNADDMLMPWCLDCVSMFVERTPGCQWVTGIPTVYDGEGRLLWTANVAPYYRRAWIRRRWYSPIGLGVIQQESTFFRRALFERVGGLDTKMKLAGDFDLWCRFAEHAELHQLGTVVSGYRLHEANLMGDGSKYFAEGRAVRIPGGKFLGYTHSFLTFLWQRWRRTPRLADLLAPGLSR